MTPNDTLAQQRERHARDLVEAVDEVTLQLRGMPEVRRVVLFGSHAAGRRDLSTDLDVLVVMDSELDFATRNAQLASRIRCAVALDLLAYTPTEMERMRHRPFVRQALETGRVLYENPGT